MKTVKMYEAKEEVYIRATILNAVMDGDTIKYKLRNKATGKDDDFLYAEEHIVPVVKPVPKTPAKKPTTKK